MNGQQFANFAETQCGSKGFKYQSFMNQNKNDSWSASFVSFCNSECAVPDTFIPKTSRCQDICDSATSNDKKSTWVPGPCQGAESNPEPGDVVVFDWTSTNKHRADCVGIVTSYDVENECFEVVIGDSGSTGPSNSTVRMFTYSKKFSCIKGYIRPRWELIP